MPRGKKKVVEDVGTQVMTDAPVRKTRKRKPAEEVVAVVEAAEVDVVETPDEVVATVEPVAQAVVTRKPYPSHEERIDMAEKQIDRLSKLNAEREALIAKTEKTLAARKIALEKSVAQLEKVVAKKAHIVATKEKSMLSAAERAAAKQAAKAEEKLKINQLMDALKASGKSLEDLLEDLTGKDDK